MIEISVDWAKELVTKMPALASIIEEVKAKGGTETDVLSQYMTWAAQHPEEARDQMAMLQVQADALQAPQEPPAPLPLTLTREQSLAPSEGAPIVIADPSGIGRHRLNPMYEATLQERVAFDGDLPEFRFGPMPAGATPAVPVATDVHDPVLYGQMLQQASKEVQAEARTLADQQVTLVREIVERVEKGEAAVAVLQEILPDRYKDALEITQNLEHPLRLLDREYIPDPEGYERGNVPALRLVETPSALSSAELSTSERQQYTWAFVSTTQGRRSACGVIRHHVLKALGSPLVQEWHSPHAQAVPDSAIVGYAEWTFSLSGEGSTQPSFSYIDVAASVLTRHLLKGGLPEVPTYLEVFPINTVDIRKVGWGARLVKRT